MKKKKKKNDRRHGARNEETVNLHRRQRNKATFFIIISSLLYYLTNDNCIKYLCVYCKPNSTLYWCIESHPSFRQRKQTDYRLFYFSYNKQLHEKKRFAKKVVLETPTKVSYLAIHQSPRTLKMYAKYSTPAIFRTRMQFFFFSNLSLSTPPHTNFVLGGEKIIIISYFFFKSFTTLFKKRRKKL